MAIKRHKRGNRVYLAEYKQVRVGKKVKSIFIRYIGPEDEVKKGRMPKKRVLDKIQMDRSTRAGDVRLLWQIAQDLDFVGIIDRICCQEFHIDGPSPGKFLTAWAINRAIDPESCTQLERWVKTTDIPLLTGIEPELFTKDAFLSSLDFICRRDTTTNRMIGHIQSIDDTLYQKRRYEQPLPPGKKETVAYDLTSILFFGVDCPLAQLGRNPNHIKRQQVNLAILVSKYDKYPLAHFVYDGNRKDASTVKNLLSRLNEIKIKPGTLIWDRGNVSKKHVQLVESAEWNLICGVPKNSNEAIDILDNTAIQPSPNSYIQNSKSGHIYAEKTNGQLYGRDRSVVVYLNQDRHAKKINEINESLAEIKKQLDKLNEKGKKWSEAELHKEIAVIIGSWKDYVHVRVKRKSKGPRIEWKFKKREIANLEQSYAKYLLLSTDETISAEEIIKAYFEKDFVEKVFRMLKTEEEIEPVRHRLENRVRAYMFVCVLSYRLLSALQFKFLKTEAKESSWEQAFDLLNELGRVERTEVGFGKEVKIWYLNVTKSIGDKLKKIGMKDLLKEEVLLKL
jgi:transposase